MVLLCLKLHSIIWKNWIWPRNFKIVSVFLLFRHCLFLEKMVQFCYIWERMPCSKIGWRWSINSKKKAPKVFIKVSSCSYHPFNIEVFRLLNFLYPGILSVTFDGTAVLRKKTNMWEVGRQTDRQRTDRREIKIVHLNHSYRSKKENNYCRIYLNYIINHRNGYA